MDKIEVKILNWEQLGQAEKMMVAMARLTQRGHRIENMADFESLLNKPYTSETVQAMAALPHPTLQKFALINIVIIGASRRFLAQITRHQNEIKFMSGSLQYSDYSDSAQFVVPYELLAAKATGQYSPDPVQEYLASCKASMQSYSQLAKTAGNDAAGYAAPQGLRNVLVMSVLPFELMHIISQRTCNRNTSETQYVMLRIWEQLYKDPLYARMWKHCGPACQVGPCPEGKLCCGNAMYGKTPMDILEERFPLIYKRDA